MIVSLVAYLAFGVFGIHTLIWDNKVDEAAPVFASGAAVATSEPLASATSTTSGVTVIDQTTTTAESSTAVAPAATTIAAPETEIVVLVAGSFVDRSHPATGTAEVLNDGSPQRFLRFEDFEVDNGPDLFVYLTTADADASASDFGREGEFVNLGVLKGNIGSQNYEIPENVDLSEFDTVVIWCRRFAVAFAAADLL